MSTRIVECSNCLAQLKIKGSTSGKLRCPKCEALIEVPAAVAAPSNGSQAASFPEMNVSGPAVDPVDCVEPGTGLAVSLGYAAVCFGALMVAAATMGIGLIFMAFAPLVNYFNRQKALALIHGSGVKVGPEQFPELNDCVETLWDRLSNGPRPEVYIIEATVMNAFAVRFGRKNLVLLTDDMIHGCLRSSDPRTLAFVVAHELAHVALNHNSTIRTSLSSSMKKLSRLDEYTADRVAMSLIGEPQVVVEGIVLLTVGPHLLQYINYDALREQVSEVTGNKHSKKAERPLTHPLLLHRLDRAFRQSV